MSDSGKQMRQEWQKRADWISDNYHGNPDVIAEALENTFNEGVTYGRKYYIPPPQEEDGGS